jgi:hypothetical protein
MLLLLGLYHSRELGEWLFTLGPLSYEIAIVALAVPFPCAPLKAVYDVLCTHAWDRRHRFYSWVLQLEVWHILLHD